MKHLFTFLLSFMFIGLGFSQSNVYLKINHKLGTNDFAFSSAASNNLGNDFSASRLEYYISEITLVHDGGTETVVADTWILANGGTTVNELLGSYSITTLEAVKFGIGVDEAHNHLDPASFATGHPLAPKSPSMHWGWSAGYRFVAMEGMSGSSLSQGFEIHALGDGNYFVVIVNTSGTTSGSDLIIELDGDYEKALYGVDVSSGLINHGESGEAAVLLRNFRDKVFSETASSVGIEKDLTNNALQFTLAPNPASGHTTVLFSNNSLKGINLRLTDLSGKLIQEINGFTHSAIELSAPAAGLYFVTVSAEGMPPASQKLLIRQ